MAVPPPDPAARPAEGQGGPARGLVIAAAGIAALAAGVWLGVREPAPTPTSVPPQRAPIAAAPPQPAAPAPAPAPAPPAPVAAPQPAPSPAPSPAPPPASATASAPPPAAALSASQAPAPAAVAPTRPTPPAAIATAPPAVAPIPAPALEPPRFDIVRINPQGGTVMAGRAAPGTTVILRANGREIGRTRADAQGQWVMADAAPLPPGAHEITVGMLDPAGREITGAATVQAVVATPPAPVASAASVPGAPSAAPSAAPSSPAAPIVVMTTPQGAPVLLQSPARAGGPRLGLDIVDYDNAGEIRFAGTAPSGNVVRLYVDDIHVGDAQAGADGRWSLVPPQRVAQGEHRLRLDQVDRAGRVAARVEQPFQRAAVEAPEAGLQRVVVQPRQNLWRIARRVYGQGVRYTEIHAANRDVITDPARIFPGQVFTIPATIPAPGASIPSSASRSR